MSDTYPGIEILLASPDGQHYYQDRSDTIHFWLTAAHLHIGNPPDTWHVMMMGTDLVVWVRAVDLPALPDGATVLAALGVDVDPAAAASTPGGTADNLHAAELVDQAPDVAAELGERVLEDLEDLEAPPPAGHRGCCCHGGFSGDHVCCIHPAETPAAAAPTPGGMVQTAAAAVTASPVMTESTGNELSRSTWAGARIARIARRARSLLGRS